MLALRSAMMTAALLTVSACTSTTMPDGSTRMSLSPANLFPAQTAGSTQPAQAQGGGANAGTQVDPALVQRVAARFARDHREGGMAGLVSDIRACYAAAERGGPDRSALRDCIALDTAAKHQDMVNARRFPVPGMDYLTDNAALARLNQYGPQVFANAGEGLNFVKYTGNAVFVQGTHL